MLQLTDLYQRKFSYLRLSITDVCNFRCQYCLPNGYQPLQRRNFLSLDEIKRLTDTFTEFGMRKIRLTGGEPTLRRDFLEIVRMLSTNPQIKTLALTTNGYRMAKEVRHWKESGLTDINVSVDSLHPGQFKQITGQDKFNQVMQGIDAAFDAGFNRIKVNSVLMKDLNDSDLSLFLQWIKNRSIQLRFIELMETGSGRQHFQQYHISGEIIRAKLQQQGWQLQPRESDAGPALVFNHPDYLGEVGLIMPYSKDFCTSCNRLRVSATGNLHLCLFGENGVNLRDLLDDDTQLPALRLRILNSLQNKRKSHLLHENNTGMTQGLYFIGG